MDKLVGWALHIVERGRVKSRARSYGKSYPIKAVYIFLGNDPMGPNNFQKMKNLLLFFDDDVVVLLLHGIICSLL